MIRLENIENKELLLKDFFTWLFEDENIVLYHEEDLSLCHDYSDCNIYYPSGIKDFFETSFMQRLNRISQLGLAINVNQNLYNNRLEHSKGVYNRKVEEFFYNYQNPSWKKYIEDNNLKPYIIGDLIKMAGHDIGHLPLSHVFEMYAFNQKGAHEEIGKKIMLQDPEICSILKKIHPDLPKIIDELYNKKLLNFSEHDESSYDVDRIDFLSRDSLYYGYLSYLPVQSYETVNIKVDEKDLPLEDSDNSIIQDNTSSKSIDVYDYGTTKNDDIKKGDNGYIYEIDDETEYPIFTFRSIVDEEAKISTVELYYKLDADNPTNEFIEGKDVRIVSWDGDAVKSGQLVNVSSTIGALKLLDSYFEPYGGNYTYIVIKVTDDKGNVTYQRIQIIRKAHLFDLT